MPPGLAQTPQQQLRGQNGKGRNARSINEDAGEKGEESKRLIPQPGFLHPRRVLGEVSTNTQTTKDREHNSGN